MFGKFLPSSASATINRSEIDRHIHLKYRLLKNKLAKGFQTNEEERRSILQLVIDSADNFIKKAGVVRCLLVSISIVSEFYLVLRENILAKNQNGKK